MNKEMNEFLNQTLHRVRKHSVKCGICKEWFVREGIDRHLRLRHPEEYKQIKESYYLMVENWRIK